MSVRAAYNDNATLRDEDSPKENLFRLVGTYEMDIERVSRNTSFTFNPRITRDYYPDRDKSELESTDYFLRGGYSHRRPTLSWGLSWNVDRQSVLSNDNTVAQSSGNTNFFRADDIQYTYRLSPSIAWQISPQDQLSFGISARKTDFDLDYTGRSDVDSYSFNTSYIRTVTLRQKIGLSGSLTHSEAEGTNCRVDLNFLTNPGNPQPPIFDPCTNVNNPAVVNAFNRNETDSYSISLDYNYKWSENLALVAAYGLQSSDSSQIVRDADGVTLLIDSDTFDPNPPPFGSADPLEELNSTFESTTYDLTLKHELERSDYTININRQVIPSQAGTPQDRYGISFNGTTKLTQKLSSTLRLRAFEQESILIASDDNTTDIDRKTRYFQGDIGLSWRWTRKLSINGSYIYRYRDRDGISISDTTTSSSNALSFGVSYKFRELR